MCKHDNKCCICFHSIPKSYPTLSCGHKVHPKCMRKWDKTCPLCRANVKILPFTRREIAVKKIYSKLDQVLDPLWQSTVYWRNNPDSRDVSNLNDIWQNLDNLLSYIWENRDVLRRDYKFIDTMRKRTNGIIVSCSNHSTQEWKQHKNNIVLKKKFKFILARI